LNHALALDSKLAEAWSHRGVVWFAKRDFTRAIADYDQALKLAPGLAGVYCSRGVTWLAQGKPAEAEADFGRCRALGGLLKPEAEAFLQEMKGRRAPK
jgi:Tfp pilus assembly protein PilF